MTAEIIELRGNVTRGRPTHRDPRPHHKRRNLLFRGRDLILGSEEADLIRDVRLDIDKAETKLRKLRERARGLQKSSAAELQKLAAADTKLAAAIVAALLSP